MTVYNFTNPGLDDARLKLEVGKHFHLGLSDGTRFYGYMLEPNPDKGGGFIQRTDTATKDALIAYSSGQLIDRDLAWFPRVTDGDFSGGGFQEVFIDQKKFFDADLDPRIPGFLQLRPQWTRISKSAITPGPSFQVVAWKGDFWYTFGEASGNFYSANGGTTSAFAGAVAIVSLDTDGTYLYAGSAGNLWRTSDGVNWTAVTTAINGTATQWWIINQGTNGYFAYYQSGPNLLYKVDLTQTFPIAAAAQAQVPVGSNAINIVDLCEYQTSIAVVTTDVAGPGSDVWYFDGNNLTRIVRIDGYTVQGICQSLGSLFASGFALGKITSPKLFKVDAGVYDEVVIPGSPFPGTGQSCLQPRSSGRYVYWPILNPSIAGISTGKGAIVQLDVLTGAASKLPCQDTTDFTTQGGALRAVALLGDNVAAIWANGTTGVLQYQITAFGSIKYQASGWLASSHIDFATPGITKRFRRIEVHHAPLAAGEAVDISAFVDQDPLGFSTTLPPVPASQAGGHNVTVGSTITALTMGSDTVGKTLYFALKLTAGTSGNTTPRVSYVSIEVGGTWVWEVNLACTAKRTLLNGQADDQQGAKGSDLAYLLFISQENGNLLTFYHRNGQTYTVTIESLEAWNPSPQQSLEAIPDEEYIVKAVLRQVA